jgi:four helix bundle protein
MNLEILMDTVLPSSLQSLHHETMEDFMSLRAAQVSMDLVEEVYRLCKKLPREELYGLSSQLKRAVSSIVANIAEGYGRYTFRDKASRYTISRGECVEVSAYLLIAVRIRLLQPTDTKRALALALETKKLLSGLISSCRQRDSSFRD